MTFQKKGPQYFGFLQFSKKYFSDNAYFGVGFFSLLFTLLCNRNVHKNIFLLSLKQSAPNGSFLYSANKFSLQLSHGNNSGRECKKEFSINPKHFGCLSFFLKHGNVLCPSSISD